VNGQPFRGSFLTSDRNANHPSSMPKHLIVEDCDVIYARGVFTTSMIYEPSALFCAVNGHLPGNCFIITTRNFHDSLHPE
jgi:hypothetical protein